MYLYICLCLYFCICVFVICIYWNLYFYHLTKQGSAARVAFAGCSSYRTQQIICIHNYICSCICVCNMYVCLYLYFYLHHMTKQWNCARTAVARCGSKKYLHCSIDIYISLCICISLLYRVVAFTVPPKKGLTAGPFTVNYSS